jgi:hypothetical protein
MTNVKGVADSSLQVRTWVKPRREDIAIGMRNAPSIANRAKRDLSIEGIERRIGKRADKR